MSAVDLRIDTDLAILLQDLNLPIRQAVRELITLELYRRGAISSGKAAQLLEMSRWEFVRYASHLGIAFFDMTEEEWEHERDQARKI